MGREQLRDLLMKSGGPLSALLASEGLPPLIPVVHLPRDRAGREMSDIRTEDESIAFADTLTQLIKSLTDRDDTRLHVSMAGGRKTMSAYASLAISLFGRDHDELSHMLVEPEAFERARDFFWPRQHSKARSRDGTERNPGHATIHLFDTPFVRLRHLLTNMPAFPGGNPDYRRIVDAARAALRQPRVRLVVAERTPEIGGFEPLQLGQTEFSFYLLLATARREAWAGTGPDGIGTAHTGWLTYELLFDAGRGLWRRYLALYDDMLVQGVIRSDDLREELTEAIRARQAAGDASLLMALQRNRFQPMKSNLISAIGEGIPNPSIAAAVNVATVRQGISRFGLERFRISWKRIRRSRGRLRTLLAGCC